MAVKAAEFHDIYELLDNVRQGEYALVFKCEKMETKEEYAVKVLRSDTTPLPIIMRELKICRMVNHTNIVKLVDYHVGRTFGCEIHYLVFNMEWGGELFEDITRRKTYTEYDACHCIEQILNGVNYLHKNNIVHRELRPRNILLTDKYKDAVVKIADFGSAEVLLTSEKFKYCGAEKGFYMAPEMLCGRACMHSVDIWACGVLLYVMLLGKPPFYGNVTLLIVQMTSRVFWLPESGSDQSLCDESRDLLRLLLNPNPESRISAEEALRHTFIRKRKDVATRFHRQKTVEELKTYNADVKSKWKNAVKFITSFMKLKKDDDQHSKGDVFEQPNKANPVAASDIACATSHDSFRTAKCELASQQSQGSATNFYTARETSVMAQMAGNTLRFGSSSYGITDPRRRSRPRLRRAMAFDKGGSRDSSTDTSQGDHTSAGIESLPSFYEPDRNQTDDDVDALDELEELDAANDKKCPRESHSG